MCGSAPHAYLQGHYETEKYFLRPEVTIRFLLVPKGILHRSSEPFHESFPQLFDVPLWTEIASSGENMGFNDEESHYFLSDGLERR